HLSITVTLGMVLADLGLLIFFIHHVATSIQLPQVVASIAGDLSSAIDAEFGGPLVEVCETGPSDAEVRALIAASGAVVPATRSARAGLGTPSTWSTTGPFRRPRPPSTTRLPIAPGSAGSATGSANCRCDGTPARSTATNTAGCASLPPERAITGWSSAPSTR